MKVMRHWRVILAVILVFAAGGVTGSVVTVLHLKRQFERGFNAENKTAEVMEELQRDLKLTPEQQPRIKAILTDSGHKFEGCFGKAMRESGTNMVAAWEQIERELTPEQRVIFQQKCQKFREGVKKNLKIDLPKECGGPSL
jgi:Spy/CpxP family protein refolding chaperone